MLYLHYSNSFFAMIERSKNSETDIYKPVPVQCFHFYPLHISKYSFEKRQRIEKSTGNVTSTPVLFSYSSFADRTVMLFIHV